MSQSHHYFLIIFAQFKWFFCWLNFSWIFSCTAFTNWKTSFYLVYPCLIFLLLVDQFCYLRSHLVNLWFSLSLHCEKLIVVFRPVDASPFESFFFGEGKMRSYVFACDFWVNPKFVLVFGGVGSEGAGGGGSLEVIHSWGCFNKFIRCRRDVE